eukprot:7390540-Prymnesium_polylepis.6
MKAAAASFALIIISNAHCAAVPRGSGVGDQAVVDHGRVRTTINKQRSAACRAGRNCDDASVGNLQNRLQLQVDSTALPIGSRIDDGTAIGQHDDRTTRPNRATATIICLRVDDRAVIRYDEAWLVGPAGADRTSQVRCTTSRCRRVDDQTSASDHHRAAGQRLSRPLVRALHGDCAAKTPLGTDDCTPVAQ